MNAIAVIGLGMMGRGMAVSLQRAGLEVVGTDISQAARTFAVGQGIEILETPAAAASRANTFVLSLPAADAVTAVIAGPGGLLSCARKGSLIIDTSTSHPHTTRNLARRLQDAGLSLIDAPVSGGAKAAAAGELTMLVGGSQADVTRAEPVLAAMSSKRFHIGQVGAGHVAKIANNLMVAIHLLAAGEVTRLASQAGVPTEPLLEAINASSGRSGVTQVNFPTWILNGSFNSGFSMKLMRKDVGLAAELIAQSGLGLPLAEQAASLWRRSAVSIADGEDFNRIVGLEL